MSIGVWANSSRVVYDLGKGARRTFFANNFVARRATGVANRVRTQETAVPFEAPTALLVFLSEKSRLVAAATRFRWNDLTRAAPIGQTPFSEPSCPSIADASNDILVMTICKLSFKTCRRDTPTKVSHSDVMTYKSSPSEDVVRKISGAHRSVRAVEKMASRNDFFSFSSCV